MVRSMPASALRQPDAGCSTSTRPIRSGRRHLVRAPAHERHGFGRARVRKVGQFDREQTVGEQSEGAVARQIAWTRTPDRTDCRRVGVITSGVTGPQALRGVDRSVRRRGPNAGADAWPVRTSARSTRPRWPWYGSSSSSMRRSSPAGLAGEVPGDDVGKWKSPTGTASGSPSAGPSTDPPSTARRPGSGAACRSAVAEPGRAHPQNFS